jgi:hypothetical protein
MIDAWVWRSRSARTAAKKFRPDRGVFWLRAPAESAAGWLYRAAGRLLGRAQPRGHRCRVFGSAVISGVIAAKDLDSLYVTEPLYLELVDGQLPPAGTLTERVSPGTRVRRFPDPPRTLTLASGAIVAFVRVQVISTGTTHPDVSSAMAQTLAADPVAQPNDVGWMGAWPNRLSDRNSFALDGG